MKIIPTKLYNFKIFEPPRDIEYRSKVLKLHYSMIKFG